MIEGYKPSAEEETAWRAERDAFIERTFGSITVGALRSNQTPPLDRELFDMRRRQS